MRGWILYLIPIVIASFSLLVISMDSEEPISDFEFSTFTSAVCESREDFIHCKDELFVNCDGIVSRASEIEECNGIKLESNKVSGFAVFDKDWKDIRN